MGVDSGLVQLFGANSWDVESRIYYLANDIGYSNHEL
jgi:hypothetical protein